ncbi:hypothetical protein BH23ACI1_BH23ACI1_19210 [soil metagenome]
MFIRVAVLVLCGLAAAVPARAQDRPATLATLFEDIFGPSGLVVSSDEVLVDGTNHAAHFNSAFQSDFRLMNIALTSQLAAVPLPSPASGFTYRFDPETGTFVRSTSSYGPILTERGETIGRGRLAFGFSYQFFSFDRLDGVGLTSVPAVFTHDNFEAGGGRTDVVFTRNTIKADVRQFNGALTYGVTDRVDLSLAVPIISTHLSLISNARIHRVGTGHNTTIHYFRNEAGIDGRGDTNQFVAEGWASGVGDLVLRAKATVMKERNRALAAGLDARLPTGDEQNLLGSGALGLRAFGAFSTSVGGFAPHVNLAYQWNGQSVLGGDVRSDQKGDLPDQFHWAVGTDFTINNRLSIVADLLGRRVINSPRLSTYDFVAAGPAEVVILPDIRFENASYSAHNGAVGFKANVAPRVLAYFNLRFQINGGGLSDRISPLLGVEWGF